MIRLLFILFLFSLMLMPLWYIARKVLNKVIAELETNPDQYDLDDLKQRKKVLGRRISEQEKELGRKQKSNEKIKEEIKDGRF